jgi:hypothetical protein
MDLLRIADESPPGLARTTGASASASVAPATEPSGSRNTTPRASSRAAMATAADATGPRSDRSERGAVERGRHSAGEVIERVASYASMDGGGSPRSPPSAVSARVFGSAAPGGQESREMREGREGGTSGSHRAVGSSSAETTPRPAESAAGVWASPPSSDRLHNKERADEAYRAAMQHLEHAELELALRCALSLNSHSPSPAQPR